MSGTPTGQMDAPSETQSIIHQSTAHLNMFAQNVNAQATNTNTAVRELTQAVTHLATTTSTSIAQTQEQLGAVALALQHPINAPAPDLTPLLTRLAEAQTAQRPALKIDPPPFNGRGNFRDWKRKLELIYNARRLSEDEKLPWTLALLQEGALRVAAHANPADYDELMDVLTRRYTDGNDAFHAYPPPDRRPGRVC